MGAHVDRLLRVRSAVLLQHDDPRRPHEPGRRLPGTLYLHKSTNGGSTWTQLISGWGGAQQVHQDIQEILVDPSGANTFYVGSDGGLWKSVNGGSTFTNLNGNVNSFLFYAIGVHPTAGGTICGGAQDNSSVARQSSNVWDVQAVTGDGFVCHIDPVQPNYAYITSYPSGRPNVSRSTSGIFGSFSGITGSGSGISSGDRVNWVTPYILDPVTPSTLYLGTHRVYKSLDHGSNWEQVGPTDLTGGGFSTILSLDVNRSFPSIVLAGTTNGRVWRSADAGETWTDLTTGLPGRAVNDLASDPTDPQRSFAVLGGFNGPHLYEWTADGGWIARGATLPNVPANTVVMLDGTTLYVATDVGVFRSLDRGVTFTPYMDGMPVGAVVTDLKPSGALDLLTAATYGRGAWQVSVEPVLPIVVYASIDLPPTEVNGDGDLNVEPGETWEVTPRLRNSGGVVATGVSARLTTGAAGVVFDAPVRGYGDIAGGTSAPPLLRSASPCCPMLRVADDRLRPHRDRLDQRPVRPRRRDRRVHDHRRGRLRAPGFDAPARRGLRSESGGGLVARGDQPGAPRLHRSLQGPLADREQGWRAR